MTTTLLDIEPTVREAEGTVQFSWPLATDAHHPGLPGEGPGVLELVLLARPTRIGKKGYVAVANVQLAVGGPHGYTVSDPLDATRVLFEPIDSRVTAAGFRAFTLAALAAARQAAAEGHLDRYLAHQEET